MANFYEVTATALNLRAAPALGAAVLTVLRRNQVCVGAGAASGGWLPVVFEQYAGYVGASFVRALNTADAVPSADLPASPAATSTATSTPSHSSSAATSLASTIDPEQRLRDPTLLHPTFRNALQTLLARCDAENLQFRVFESYRTPERQAWLYAQGRTRAGDVVTKARAWESFHQFGLAADLVLFINGQWSWSDAGGLGTRWTRMRQMAAEVGLRTLSWEVPHVEWPVDLAGAVAGPMLADGDEGWLDNLQLASARWSASGGGDAPLLAFAERPALPAVT